MGRFYGNTFNISRKQKQSTAFKKRGVRILTAVKTTNPNLVISNPVELRNSALFLDGINSPKQLTTFYTDSRIVHGRIDPVFQVASSSLTTNSPVSLQLLPVSGQISKYIDISGRTHAGPTRGPVRREYPRGTINKSRYITAFYPKKTTFSNENRKIDTVH